MQVSKVSVLAVFEPKQRLEVPLFQRQYVWSEEQQWFPLWEDIARKFSEKLEGRSDAPNHFLGAMVLDQKQTPTGHVIIRQIIDGQQRLTTLQIFLAAYRDFCRMKETAALAEECDKFLFNKGMMSDPDVDKFKIWPTQLDRQQFSDVISAGSRDEVLRRYPLRRRAYARKPEPRPRMIEAYLFFLEQLKVFFIGDNENPPLAKESPMSDRLDECFQALRNALMVVVIDLDKEDDPQVIFETLNARGEPLLPADLLKNYIFFRANRSKLDIEASYKKYWARFDDNFWREEVKQGRLNRPRSDLFMQHFLSSRQAQDIPIKHLYVEYRHWIETESPFPDVISELATLARQGDHFRRIIAPEKDDILFPLCKFLEAFDISTAYPLLLAFMESDLDDEEWLRVSDILESYLLRRAVCNIGTKNYNRIFLSLTRNLRKVGFNAPNLKSALVAQTGESSLWPDDVMFRQAWLHKQLYVPLSSPKLVHIYSRLNRTFMSTKSESIAFNKPLTIEHIMPQNWTTNWPLQDGSKGLDFLELIDVPLESARATATRNRDSAVQTLGNMTILTSALNSSQSNAPWHKKKPELMKHSLLPINQHLASLDVWDEASILHRGEELYQRALTIWSRA